MILRVYHELPHEEIAKALGSSVSAAKANLFHALGNLRSATARRKRGGEGGYDRRRNRAITRIT